MTEPRIAGRLPLSDFLVHLLSKMVVVIVSGFLVPGLIAAGLFLGLRWAGFVATSVYFGQLAFAVALAFCLLEAAKFNSKLVIRRLCAERRTSKIFFYPHPIVRDAKDEDTLSQRVERFCAIAVIEAKGYTIAFGVAFLILYLGLLHFFREYDRGSLVCKTECDIFWYWVKSIGSGPLFDFFEAFHIQLSHIEDGSFFFRTTSYLAKIVSVLLVLQTICVYLGFRRRFRWVLRSSGLATGDSEAGFDQMLKSERSAIGPGGIFMALPPWWRSKSRSKTEKSYPKEPSKGPPDGA